MELFGLEKYEIGGGSMNNDIERIKQKYKRRIEYIMENLENNPDYDEEDAHIDADEVLCELLREIGFDDIVRMYNRIPKWYA